MKISIKFDSETHKQDPQFLLINEERNLEKNAKMALNFQTFHDKFLNFKNLIDFSTRHHIRFDKDLFYQIKLQIIKEKNYQFDQLINHKPMQNSISIDSLQYYIDQINSEDRFLHKKRKIKKIFFITIICILTCICIYNLIH